MQKQMTFFVPAKDACADHQTDAPIVAVKVGEQGFWPIYTGAKADDLNADGVTPEILRAAVIGSMFGWRVPGAALAVAFAELNGRE